jgi:hypothetical protein
MSALIWKAAVPAGQYAELSAPRMVRHGKAAPRSPSSRALPRLVEDQVAPAQGIGGGVRQGQC